MAKAQNAHGRNRAVEDVDAQLSACPQPCDACTAVEQQGALVEVEDIRAVLLGSISRRVAYAPKSTITSSAVTVL